MNTARTLPAAALAALIALSPARGADTPETLRAEAYVAAQWAVQTAAAAAVAQMGARFAAGTDELAAIVRARQDLVGAWRGVDKQLLDALSATDDAGRARAEILRAELTRLDGEIAKIDATLERDFPDYAALANPKPVSIADTQALLRPDEALVLILVAENASYVWAIAKDTVIWNRAEIGAKTLSETVGKLRRDLDPTGGSLRAAETAFDEDLQQGGKPFDRQSAFSLYQTLLAPVAEVLDGKRHVMAVPSGALTALPLGVLVTAPPQGSDTDPESLRTTDWLAVHYALTTLPSVSSLKALRDFKERAAASVPFRGFGNPILEGPGGGGAGGGADGETRGATTQSDDVAGFFRGGQANLEAVKALAPLPQTERELKALSQAFGTGDDAILLAAAATETAVKQAKLDDVSVIAFATHGLIAGEIVGLAEPALVFTPPDEASETDDGLLTASEAAQLKLSADWVVLSACNTAAGTEPGAEGLSGLARAFFYAGARALLVSHWPVRDDAAAFLTKTAVRELRAEPGIGRAEAMRRSMVTLMNDTADPTLAHPSSWAPFALVGEGG